MTNKHKKRKLKKLKELEKANTITEELQDDIHDVNDIKEDTNHEIKDKLEWTIVTKEECVTQEEQKI